MTQVKHFHAEQVGAPTVNGVQGTLINMLDACLVNGFGLKSVDSLVVAGNVATVNITTGHSMQPDMVALMEGATPSGLNGEKRVISTTTNSFTFAAPGISDQTATGTITTKVAPLGWEKPFSATNVAVYRPSSVEGTRMYLRVDESADGREARVRGYENMTDATTGTGPFPTTSQLASGLFWPKASTTGSNQRDWTIIGDHRTVYVHLNCVDSGSSPNDFRKNGCVWSFGDFIPFRVGNPYACLLQGTSTGQYGQNGSMTSAAEYASSGFENTNLIYMPRNFTAVGGAASVIQRASGSWSGSGNSGNVNQICFPNGPDNGLVLAGKTYVTTLNALQHVEGRSRGIYITNQNCHQSFNQRDKIDGTGELAGRKILAVKAQAPNRGEGLGVVFFDITGPWGA